MNAVVEAADKRWKIQFQQFLGGLMVRILGSQLMWPRFTPWSGNKDATSHTAQSKKKEKVLKIHSSFPQEKRDFMHPLICENPYFFEVHTSWQ